MKRLRVIGSPSLDTIHIGGETLHGVGGAGLYVSMAARWNGIQASMFGPRPETVPPVMQPFADNLHTWIGPVIPAETIPHFELRHNGEKAEYIRFEVEAEEMISTDLLPTDLSGYDAIHITAMGDSGIQMAFYNACRAAGARKISLGTYLGNIIAKPGVSLELAHKADVFFINEEEAVALFGSLAEVSCKPGQLIFVTLAEKGVLVIQGRLQTLVPAAQVQVKDPTGAGESFCGAALANLLLGQHPVLAAMQAVLVAAEKIRGIGPNALMGAPRKTLIPLDSRVRLNHDQIRKVSDVVKNLPAADPFSFTSDYLPPVDHPAALEYFFAVTLQQFSFWEDDGSRYTTPLVAEIDGTARKGSGYMYYAFMRPLQDDPDFYSPQRQAQATLEEFAEIFRADDGTVQMPALELHVQQANQYGRDMLALGLNPGTLLERAAGTAAPLQTFLELLDHVGGYKEDPVRKKSSLLALSLSQRPEGFLRFGAGETVSPVVDYHCMRTILRTGLLDVQDEALAARLSGRKLLQPDEEWAVRHAGYLIQQQVELLSGKPIGAVDWFFFNYMRSHCPEMTDPVCSECALDAICARRKEMFQPVLRTTNY